MKFNKNFSLLKCKRDFQDIALLQKTIWEKARDQWEWGVRKRDQDQKVKPSLCLLLALASPWSSGSQALDWRAAVCPGVPRLSELPELCLLRSAVGIDYLHFYPLYFVVTLLSFPSIQPRLIGQTCIKSLSYSTCSPMALENPLNMPELLYKWFHI